MLIVVANCPGWFLLICKSKLTFSSCLSTRMLDPLNRSKPRLRWFSKKDSNCNFVPKYSSSSFTYHRSSFQCSLVVFLALPYYFFLTSSYFKLSSQKHIMHGSPLVHAAVLEVKNILRSLYAFLTIFGMLVLFSHRLLLNQLGGLVA